MVHLCIEKVFSKQKTNEEGRKIHVSRRFFVIFHRWNVPPVSRNGSMKGRECVSTLLTHECDLTYYWEEAEKLKHEERGKEMG